MSGALHSWIDGRSSAVVPADDRGLAYGDGLFETIAIRAGKPRFLEAHLARLAHGCARLAIAFDAWEGLRADLARALSMAPPLAVLKIIVTRGSSERRGYAPGVAAARRIVTLWPSTEFEWRDGVQMSVATLRLGENPALAGLKHLNRLENVLAAAELANSECFDALLLDSADHVIGGTCTNVFVVRGGRLATPLVARCGIAGVLRGIVLREAPLLGVPVDQQQIPFGEMMRAEEVFVTNARIGVVPVLQVGEHSFAMGEVTRRFRDHIEPLDA